MLILVGATSLYVGGVSAARKFHAAIVYNIHRSPMSFFDTTPQGRILNRFGKDIDVIDNSLVSVIQAALGCIFGALKVPIAIALSTPLFLFTLMPLGIVYFLIQVGESNT